MAQLIVFCVMSLIVMIGMLILSLRKADPVDLETKIQQRNGIQGIGYLKEEEKQSFFKKKEKELLQSGTGITLPIYYLMIAAAAIILFLLADFLLDSKAAACLVACAALLLPEYIIREKRARRKAEFDAMYVKALKRMASSLRTGSTLLQAVEDVVHTYSLPKTIREEMAAVLLDFEFQSTFEDAFLKMYERTGSEDVKSTALSIQISNRYGAKLYQALEGYASAILERKEMEAEGKAKLSSVSSTISTVSLIPFLFAFLVRLSDPTYFDGLYAFGGGLGRWILFGLYSIDVFGYFFLKHKCNIRI